MSSNYRDGYADGFENGKVAGKKEIIDMFNSAKLEPQPLMIADPIPSLRDQFAMAAMQGFIARDIKACNEREIADWSYDMADAMLEERNKRG